MRSIDTTGQPPVRRGSAGRWVVAVVAAACAIAVVGQSLAAKRDARRFPPPGRLVDVGGFRIHLQVQGDDRAGPTVVLEAGLGSFSPNWYWVQQALAPHVRVVSYDRAGLGWSDPSPAPRDAATMAVELHAALHAAGIRGPYVLAGHSFGGLVVRAFADAYRPETAGLVLVDASHPDQWARWPVPYADRIQLITLRTMTGAARLGLLRLGHPFAAVSAGLPDRQVAELDARFALPLTSATEAAQMRSVGAHDAAHPAARGIPRRPAARGARGRRAAIGCRDARRAAGGAARPVVEQLSPGDRRRDARVADRRSRACRPGRECHPRGRRRGRRSASGGDLGGAGAAPGGRLTARQCPRGGAAGPSGPSSSRSPSMPASVAFGVSCRGAARRARAVLPTRRHRVSRPSRAARARRAR